MPSGAFAKAQWTTVLKITISITLQLATFAIPWACTINTELEIGGGGGGGGGALTMGIKVWGGGGGARAHSAPVFQAVESSMQN